MILITGARGQLGWELRRALAPLAPLAAVDVDEMPLQDADAIREVMRRLRPSLVVNAAAYTAVDGAEEEQDLAAAVNGLAPAVLAEEAKRLGGGIVHYSTDYVFDGTKGAPYTERDTARPLGAYGRTKLAGEEAVRGVGLPHLILRTSWLYGTRGRNFLLTVLRQASAGVHMRVVDDQHGTPTWCRELAEATAMVIAQTGAAARPEAFGDRAGTYHVAGAGGTTWHGFAAAIQELAPRSGPGQPPAITPIPTVAFPTKARRPPDSRLDCTRFRETFGLALGDWRDSLELVMEEIRERRVFPPKVASLPGSQGKGR